MNDLEAMKLAAQLGNSFSARDDVIRAYAVAFKGYDATIMADAVEYAVENCERMPAVKGVIAMYRKAEALSRTVSAAEAPPCRFCVMEGRAAPFPATAPYLPNVTIKDDQGMVLGPAWGHPPACAGHGLKVSRERGHNGYEPPRVKEHRDEIRQWRDRCEAEHAEWAAKRIEAELALSHPAPTVAATRAFVDAAVSAPIPASAVAVAPDFQSPMETEQKNDHFSGSPLPPMTPEEEAAFNDGIRF